MNGFLYLIELIFDVMHIAPNALIDGEEVGVIIFLVGLELVGNGIDTPMVNVDFGEEGVGIFKMMADASDVEFVGVVKKRLINTLAANHEDALTIFDNAQTQHLLNALASNGVFEYVIFIAAEDDVHALWQRAVWQRLVSFSAHNDGAAGCQRLKIFQIARKVAEQFVVPADAVALVNSHYHTKFHNNNYYLQPPTAFVFSFDINYRKFIINYHQFSI